jgi:HK97 family phage prohead protease
MKFRPFTAKSAGALSLKDINETGRTVMGYFASLNTLDSDGDVFVPGCFAKSLNENKERILHLLQHDAQRPIGRPSVLKEDDLGLYFETAIPKTRFGDDVLQLYKDGVYKEHSVGFEMLNNIPLKHKGETVNGITEARLWEGSTVTWGANENTPYLGVKGTKFSLTPYDLLERAFERTQILQKTLHRGNLNDETYYKLQLELLQLQTLLTAKPDSYQASAEPDNTLPDNGKGKKPGEKDLPELQSQAGLALLKSIQF